MARPAPLRLVATCVLLATAVSTRGEITAPSPTGRPANPVIIARTASTTTLVETWIRLFRALHPELTVIESASSTDLPAKALAELVSGEVDLAPFVREIQPQELAGAAQALGFAPLGIAMATGSFATPSNTHAIAIYVHQSNPLTRLTLAQLDAIYSTTRLRGYPTAIRTWGDLGLTGEWKNRPIHPYGMVIERKTGNPHAGIVAYLIERLMLGGRFDPATRQVADTGMGRGNNRALDEIADAVAADPAAIGYAGFANRRPSIRSLALAESSSGPFVVGTIQTVAARSYPLSRTIFIYARSDKAKRMNPAVREFMRFILSEQGQAAVGVDPAGFLPLPEAFAAQERQKLD